MRPKRWPASDRRVTLPGLEGPKFVECGESRWLGCLQGRTKNRCNEYREESVIICDLCGEAKDCLQKEIEGKEYDICSECWNPFAQKLRGKGRVKSRETVFLPPPRVVKERENEEPEALPGEPP